MKTIKIISAFLFLVLLPSLSWAQEEEQIMQQDPNARKKIEAARIALITERLGLTPDQAEKFWPIYHEYAAQRQGLVKEFKAAQNDIDPNHPDPKKQQALVELGLKLKQREINLEKDYSNRMMQVITAQQILNLRTAERDFRNMIINQLQQRRLMQQRRENLRDNQRLRDRRNN